MIFAVAESPWLEQVEISPAPTRTTELGFGNTVIDAAAIKPRARAWTVADPVFAACTMPLAFTLATPGLLLCQSGVTERVLPL